MDHFDLALERFQTKRWLSTYLFFLSQIRTRCNDAQYQTIEFHHRELADIVAHLEQARSRFRFAPGTYSSTIMRSQDAFILRLEVVEFLPDLTDRAATIAELEIKTTLTIWTPHGLCVFRIGPPIELESIAGDLSLIKDLSFVEQYCNRNVLEFLPDVL